MLDNEITSSSELDFADAVQAIVDAEDSRKLTLKGYWQPITHTIMLTKKNDFKLCGLGLAPILQPTGDHDVFEVKAPCSRIKISDFQFADNLENPKHTGAAMIHLNHQGNNGAINELTLENITMYYPFNGVYSDARPCDINNALQVLAIRHVRINQFRNIALNLYNFFDTRLLDVVATTPKKAFLDTLPANPQRMGLGHGLVMKNSVDSGSQLEMVTMLGEERGAGYTLENVTHLTGSQIIADTFMEGMATSGEVDNVQLSQVELRSSRDQGLYAAHTRGRIIIDQFTVRNSTNFHVKNFGNGGNVTVLAARCTETQKGVYELATGDVAEEPYT